MTENKQIKILTIDDEDAIRHSIQAFLEDYDFNVSEAENGKIGLEKIHSDNPDLILVDLRMPEIDGLEVIKQVHTQKPDLPVIVISGTGVMADAIEAVHSGAWDYILKPIQNMSILLHSVNKCLERYRLIKENRRYQEHLEEEIEKQTTELQKANTLLKSEIEAHKKTLTALKQSERKLDSIIMTVPDIIYRLDPNGIISFISNSVKKYGYSPKDLIGQPILKLVHPEDHQIALNHINERRTGKRRTTSLELRLISYSKKYRPFEISSRSVTMDPVFHIEAEGLYDSQKNNEKKFLGTQGIARDVTDRKLAEQALKESEERLDLTLQSANLGLWDWDIVNKKIWFNQHWAKLIGWPADKLETNPKGLEKIIHPEDLSVFRELIKQHFENSSRMFEAELRVKTNKSEWKWILLRGKVVHRDKNNSPLRFTGTQLDITRRKIAEASLKTIAGAVEQATDSILLLDNFLKITYVNPAFIAVTGYSQKEIIGKHYSEINFSDANKESLREMQEFIKNQNPWFGRFGQVKKNGQEFVVEASISPIRDQNGAVTNYVLVQRDISKEEKLSEQLRQAQKMESVGRLAGGIAHDFNNLLTVISGYSSLTLSGLKADDPLHRNVKQIINASQKAESLTRQLLAFSRKQVLQPKVLNLNDSLKDLNKMLYRLIGEDIDFLNNYADDLGFINVDPGQIEQVVMNLVINARDAMPQGGKLTICTKNEVIRDLNNPQFLGLGIQPGEYIMLTVKDTGIGMDDRIKEQIFEPFFTTKEAGKGTGLGLATVYGIVHQSDGFIIVDSKPNRGSEFKIYLPRIDSQIIELNHNEQDDRQLCGSESIYVVEDEKEVRNLICNILKQHGYRVAFSINGADALKKLAAIKSPVHLLLTDVVMPKIKVTEMVDKFKLKFKKLKILYMSGHTEDVIVNHGVLNPDIEFIQKPFTPLNLLKKIRDSLDS
ncbi:MAG: PAS domain S-box protein [Calditrichaceae bacterium]|nr:PAS domain S-box protein [Calditrichaceae bacterium]